MERRSGGYTDQLPHPPRETKFGNIIRERIVVKHDCSQVPLPDTADPSRTQEIVIRDTYNWLTSAIGQMILEQTNSGFTDYARSVQKGIERTMKPREERGETTKEIARMEQRAWRARERYERKALKMKPKEEIETKADLLGAEIALSLTRQTLARMGFQPNGSS